MTAVGSEFHSRLQALGLGPATCKKYAALIDGIEGDPAAWYREKLTDQSFTLGALLPLRSAVKHYLVLMEGVDEAKARALLLPARGRPSRPAPPLGSEQVKVYCEQAAGEREPIRTVLLLLLHTGLPASKLCSLERNAFDAEVRSVGGVGGVDGKTIVLNDTAYKILAAYVAKTSHEAETSHEDEKWLFPGRGGGAISVQTIRRAVNRLGEHPVLCSLSLRNLKTTFVHQRQKAGASMASIQQELGHASIDSTTRYLGT